MCGYVERQRSLATTVYRDYLSSLGVNELPLGRFFPKTTMSGVIIQRETAIEVVDAIWWFKLQWEDGRYKPMAKVTSFNARNLSNNLWKKPVKTHRCIIPATAIVETIEDKDNPKKKHSYLMDSPSGMLLGGLYAEYKNNDGDTTYSCAVITLNPHDRFSKYHNKATPLFLPLDNKILDLWLEPSFQDFDFFRGFIDTPELPVAFNVTEVSNSQKLIPLGATECLDHDDTQS